MSVIVVTPPEPVVDLGLAKSHLRVDHDDDDDLISMQIAAATASIDGPAGTLGRALGLQQLELRQDGFYSEDWRVGGAYAWEVGWEDYLGGYSGGFTGPGRWPFSSRIRLPYPPFVSVTQITYEDPTGADQVLTPAGWTASDEGVEPSFGSGWPGGRIAANAVRIQYQAGYAAVPPPILQAILLIVGDMYFNREGQLIGNRAAVVENPTVTNLLSPFQVWA